MTVKKRSALKTFRTLPGKLALLLAATVLLSAVASWILVSRYMESRVDDLAVSQLKKDAEVFGKILHTEGRPLDDVKLTAWADSLEVRLSVLAGDGTLLADSEIPGEMLDEMDNHADRPEIRSALASSFGIDRRYSESTRTPYIYYAVKSDAAWGEHDGAIIRCSLPMTDLHSVVSHVRKLVFAALAISGLAALALGVAGVRRITKPIVELTKIARSGEGSALYPAGGSIEIEELSRAIRDGHRAVARAMKELENERNQLKTIVESAPCGLMLISASGFVTALNDAFSPLLREPRQRISGAAVDGAVRAPELVELIISARSGAFGERSFSFRGSDSEQFYKACSIEAGGDILILLENETSRRLDEEARKAFVADAGHELQTPLTSISIAAELLSDTITADEPLKYIKEIMRQRERMSILVDDLLLLSRLESGVPSSERTELDISSIVQEAAEESRQSTNVQNAQKIEWHIEKEEGVSILGRYDEIRRAVSNLLDNAVKYTARRYGDSSGGKISVRLEALDDFALLSVTDNGIGIPKPSIGRVFERFERVERDRARKAGDIGGYGLGLSIVKRVVESHGGQVAADSRDGVTRFVVKLPRLRRPSKKIPDRSKKEPDRTL